MDAGLRCSNGPQWCLKTEDEEYQYSFFYAAYILIHTCLSVLDNFILKTFVSNNYNVCSIKYDIIFTNNNRQPCLIK